MLWPGHKINGPEKLIRSRDAISAELVIAFAVVAEAMRSALEQFQFAAAADFVDGGFEFCGGAQGDERVFGAEEEKCGRRLAVDVGQRGDFAVTVLDAIVAVAAGAVVDDGIPKDGRVRS